MLYWKNYNDKETGVRGIAIVFITYDAQIHFHPVEEEYEILYGKARLYINGVEKIITAPYKTWIGPNSTHALKPITPFVIMKYYFPRGPFKNIPYTWLPSKL
tara:strand:+ start:599 stop:904 length:306 start_codon:yes stop_codon:yes gene_type:complete